MSDSKAHCLPLCSALSLSRGPCSLVLRKCSSLGSERPQPQNSNGLLFLHNCRFGVCFLALTNDGGEYKDSPGSTSRLSRERVCALTWVDWRHSQEVRHQISRDPGKQGFGLRLREASRVWLRAPHVLTCPGSHAPWLSISPCPSQPMSKVTAAPIQGQLVLSGPKDAPTRYVLLRPQCPGGVEGRAPSRQGAQAPNPTPGSTPTAL